MNNRLISIIIGSVLMVGTGSLVYIKKEPVVLPIEQNIVATSDSNKSSVKMETGTYFSDDDDDENETTTQNTNPKATTQTVQTTQASTGGITLAQINKHNSKTSCWAAINGSVYDLTSWVPNHPGGEQAILYLCGTDGSSAYNGQHGGSSKVANILGGFKIGTLTK